MIENIVRPQVQTILFDPLARVLSNWFAPNSVTVLAGIFGILATIVLNQGYPISATALLLISGACDCLDGTIARMTQLSSSFGTVLDISVDRVVEFAIILGLFSLDPVTRAWPCMWMLGSILICVTTFLVVGIFSENQTNKSFYYSPGIVERPEAFGFFIAMIALPQWFVPLAVVFTGLVFLTSLTRVVQFARQLDA